MRSAAPVIATPFKKKDVWIRCICSSGAVSMATPERKKMSANITRPAMAIAGRRRTTSFRSIAARCYNDDRHEAMERDPNRGAPGDEPGAPVSSERQRPGPDQIREPRSLLGLEDRVDAAERLDEHVAEPLGAPHAERRSIGRLLLIEG